MIQKEKYDKIFEIAKNGGRHAGWYERASQMTNSQLKKSIRSHEKQIKEHKNKINSPAEYYIEWHTRSDRTKQHDIEKWQKDIERNLEQPEIEKRIMKERNKNG